jgi:hypothetical protein
MLSLRRGLGVLVLEHKGPTPFIVAQEHHCSVDPIFAVFVTHCSGILLYDASTRDSLAFIRPLFP